MILQAPAGSPITIANPLFGYKTVIKTAMRITQRADGSFSIYDPAAAYDTYSCECSLLLPVSDAVFLIAMLTDITIGRGKSLTLTTSAGFFPFGPYRGDSGAFTVKVADVPKQNSTVGHPEDYIPFDIIFVYTGTSWPSYSPPAQVAEGELQIGSISGLRWPATNPKLLTDYGLQHLQTHGPNLYVNDQTITMDCYKLDLSLILNQGNAAALQNQLIGSTRGATVNIIPPANSYLLGVEKGSTGAYSLNWINGELSMVHERHNRFLMALTFHTAV